MRVGAARAKLAGDAGARRHVGGDEAAKVFGLDPVSVSDAYLIGIKNIQAETLSTRACVVADADAIQARLESEGDAMVAKVQGEFENKLNALLGTPGGRAFVACRRADNISFGRRSRSAPRMACRRCCACVSSPRRSWVARGRRDQDPASNGRAGLQRSPHADPGRARHHLGHEAAPVDVAGQARARQACRRRRSRAARDWPRYLRPDVEVMRAGDVLLDEVALHTPCERLRWS